MICYPIIHGLVFLKIMNAYYIKRDHWNKYVCFLCIDYNFYLLIIIE